MAVRLLADRRRRVVVVAGDAETGVGAMFATALSLVRDGVVQASGSDVAVARQMAACGADTVVVAIDLRRYERWVVEHVARAVSAGATAVAVTDSLLSPLAAQAGVAFTVSAEGAGVFDSHVGTLALANALVTGTAARLRRTATDRLDASGRRPPRRLMALPGATPGVIIGAEGRRNHRRDEGCCAGVPELPTQ